MVTPMTVISRYIFVGFTALALVLGPALCCCGFKAGMDWPKTSLAGNASHGSCCTKSQPNLTLAASGHSDHHCPTRDGQQCPASGTAAKYTAPSKASSTAHIAFEFAPAFHLALLTAGAGLPNTTMAAVLDAETGPPIHAPQATLLALHTSLTT